SKRRRWSSSAARTHMRGALAATSSRPGCSRKKSPTRSCLSSKAAGMVIFARCRRRAIRRFWIFCGAINGGHRLSFMNKNEILEKQKKYLFSCVATYYDEPLVVDHAKDQYVYDA